MRRSPPKIHTIYTTSRNLPQLQLTLGKRWGGTLDALFNKEGKTHFEAAKYNGGFLCVWRNYAQKMSIIYMEARRC